nr:DUF4230 domain-containing protein [Aurantiacibacter luteus]
MKAEGLLVVWSYQGTATVRAQDTDWWVLVSEQRLIVPASIDYRLNLTLADVAYNEAAKLVTITLPRLRLSDMAFHPEQATTINGGELTFSDNKVQAFNRRAYRTARRAITAQTQQRLMVDQAKASARDRVQSLFEIPLRIAGHPDVRVVATFD